MLILFHVVFLIAALMIIGKIAYLQFIWKPDAKYVSYFQPKRDKNEIEPQRGSLLDHNGQLLALSTPMYNVYMDCYVLRRLLLRRLPLRLQDSLPRRLPLSALLRLLRTQTTYSSQSTLHSSARLRALSSRSSQSG